MQFMTETQMGLVFISDTHGQHRQLKDLPNGDMLLHCGDFMTDGYSIEEAGDFLSWFSNVGDFKHRILIAGNHDRLFEQQQTKQKLLTEFNNIVYLEDSSIIIEGINIYGTPYQPAFRNWAFNLPRDGNELKSKWAQIPEDTDILITHYPPYGVLDEVAEGINVGCKMLNERVKQIKPTIHAFGHIHECPGEQIKDTHYVNAAVVNREYKYVYKPITIGFFEDEVVK